MVTALLRQVETPASVQIPSAWDLALNAGRVGNEFRDGCLSDRSRLAFRPPEVFLEPRKHAAEPRDHPCLRACRRPSIEPPQGLGVGVGLGLALRPGLGCGWCVPTCKIVNTDVHPSRSSLSCVPVLHLGRASAWPSYSITYQITLLPHEQ